MKCFLRKKLIQLVLILPAVAILSFALLQFSPIDPVQAYIGADMLQMSQEQRQQIAERWGLDQPPLIRYLHWQKEILSGNMGQSLIFQEPVTTVIARRFLPSLALMGAAWLLSGVIGFLLGVIAGLKENSLIDRAIRLYAYTLASTPTFWLGMLLVIIFSVQLGWTPVCCAYPPGMAPSEVSFSQWLHHLILPAATLSIISVAAVTLHTRQKLLEVLNSDFVLFAQAKGESTWGLFHRHALRHTLLPALTIQFATFGELFGGSILAEQVFSYPGLGEATIKAGLGGDIPLLLGIVLVSALFVFFGNTIADLLYTVIDPRMKQATIS
ncbi:MAG: ABC transporter permease [Candidatus Electrothrix sp. GW3-4]|uniref:ABC transporter permease n=1 Tax=Candidatus Electrothrix sp. GW3-4 TaxID=3126740 RepID=UPI0030D3D51D